LPLGGDPDGGRCPLPRQDGEISRKYGNTLIGTLRISYGSEFAKGCASDEKLSDVLAKFT